MDFAADHELGQLEFVRLVLAQVADDLAAAHHDDAVGDLHDLAQLVRDKDDGLARARVLVDEVHQDVGLLRRQHGRRFVHDQQLGVLVERLEDLDLLLDADRQVADDGGRVDVKAVLGGQVGDDLVVVLDVIPALDQAEDDVFGHRVRLHQGKVLLDHGDAQLHGVLGGMDGLLLAVDQDLAFVGAVEAVEHLHDGALARAVFAQQRQDLALADLHGDVLVGDDLGEVLADISEFDKRCVWQVLRSFWSERGYHVPGTGEPMFSLRSRGHVVACIRGEHPAYFLANMDSKSTSPLAAASMPAVTLSWISWLMASV